MAEQIYGFEALNLVMVCVDEEEKEEYKGRLYHQYREEPVGFDNVLQMIKRIVPPMSNEIITLVKDTSLARIIALQEIIWAGQAFLKGSQGISGQIWPLFFTALYYLVFSGILTILLGRLEEKLNFFR